MGRFMDTFKPCQVFAYGWQCLAAFACAVLLTIVMPTHEALAVSFLYSDDFQQSPRSCEGMVRAFENLTDTKGVDTLKVIRCYVILAKEEKDPQTRVALWDKALAGFQNIADRLENFPEEVYIYELLRSVQITPEWQLPSLHAAAQDRYSRMLSRLNPQLQASYSHGFAPTFDSFLTFRFELFADALTVVPSDLKPAYTRAVFALLEEQFNIAMNTPDREITGIPMLAIIASAPENLQPKLREQMYSTLSRALRQETLNYDDSSRAAAISVFLGILDVIRLLETVNPEFNMLTLLPRTMWLYASPEDVAERLEQLAMHPVVATKEQQTLIATLGQHFLSGYTGEYSRLSYDGTLIRTLLGVAISFFPQEPKLLAAYALALTTDWDKQAQKYRNDIRNAGLPTPIELLTQADALDPNDPVIVQAWLHVLYDTYTTLEGTPLFKKLNLAFKVGCLTSQENKTWTEWSNRYVRSATRLNTDELFKTFDVTSAQCSSFAQYVKFLINNEKYNNSETDIQFKEQHQLLESALTHPHPVIADALLNGYRAELTLRALRHNEVNEKDVAVLVDVLDTFSLSRDAWMKSRKSTYPWISGGRGISEKLLRSPYVPLTDELVRKMQPFFVQTDQANTQDLNIAWGYILFNTMEPRSQVSDTQQARNSFLQQKGFEAFEQADASRLTVQDWTTWAFQLKRKAETDNTLTSVDVQQQIIEKLERVLQLSPYDAKANAMMSDLYLAQLTSTDKEQWNNLPEKAYRHFIFATGMPPTGARAFQVWAATLSARAPKENTSVKQAMVALGDAFYTTGMQTEKERVDLLVMQYPALAKELSIVSSK